MSLPQKVTGKSRSEIRLLSISAGIAFFLLVLDQLTKLLVEKRMILGESIEVIKGFFSLTYVTNKGAAWGIFHGYGMVLFGIGMLVTIIAIVFLRKLHCAVKIVGAVFPSNAAKGFVRNRLRVDADSFCPVKL